MRKLFFPLSLTTFLLFFYLIGIVFNFPYPLISFIFGIFPFVLVWMVIKILKDGEHSGKTFDEDFYEY
ncbi:hypothetical protein C9994_10655 [Marivirga lumbricoides]|uniref:DUF4175 domain-containing protein n=1 Tax=Marivirga lumbricoides TaxID=1046115 RepID=A0A2T4DPL6_9BACT|nr:hypothetical protein C9994_10655 [Marivirga lumbricoides]